MESFSRILTIFLLSGIFYSGRCHVEEYLQGRYRLEWILQTRNVITFTATVQTGGWVGLGLNTANTMARANIAVGGVVGDGNPGTDIPTFPTFTTVSTVTTTQPIITSDLPSTESSTPNTTSATTPTSVTPTTIADPITTFPTFPTDSTLTTVTGPMTFPTMTTTGLSSTTSQSGTSTSDTNPASDSTAPDSSTTDTTISDTTTTAPPTNTNPGTFQSPTSTVPTTPTLPSSSSTPPPVSSSPAPTTTGTPYTGTNPATFPSATTPTPTSFPGLQQNVPYDHVFYGNDAGLGDEYFGTSWRFQNSIQNTVNGSVYTSVTWERDLVPSNGNETIIAPYQTVYLVLLYGDTDNVSEPIREWDIERVNIFQPGSSTGNLKGDIFMVFSTILVLYRYFV